MIINANLMILRIWAWP